MTTDRELGRRLSESFRSEPAASVPSDLHEAAMARAARSRQRPGWLVAAGGGALGVSGVSIPRTTVLVLIGGALLAAAVGSAMVAGAIKADPEADTLIETRAPVLSAADEFAVPFDYALVEGVGLRRVDAMDERMTVDFVVGPTIAPPPDAASYGWYQSDGGNPRGIVVVAALGAETHSCPSDEGRPARPMLDNSPELFLQDLRTIAGAALVARPPELVDGRPALVVDVAPNAHKCPEVADIHTTINGDYLSLEVPSRLLVLEVGHELVLIDIWARSDDDLANWLPTAMKLVGSIRFR